MKKINKFLFILVAICLVTSVHAQVDRTKAPVAGPAPKVQLGDYDTFTLKNGMKVLVVENHNLPKVSFNLQLLIDPVLEGDKSGYVSIAGSLLEAGTKTKTSQEIAEEIDFIGARLGSYSEGAYASGLSKYKDQILSLMGDVVLNPVFPEAEFDKLIKQNMSVIQSDKTSPKQIAQNVGSKVLYGKDHPYGDVMTEATLGNITLDDCKSYYATYFKPNVAVMAIVGDITTKEAKKLVKRYFGEWEAGTVPSHVYKAPKKVEGKRVVLANKDAAPQSTVQIVHLIDLKKGSEDVIPVSVMDAMLGRGFTGLLMKNLREDKGYTYGAYSRISSDQLVGDFYAGAEVGTQVTDSALIEIAFEMNKMRNESLTEDHFNMTKATLAGDFARSLEDPSTMARFALNIERYKLPADYYATYLEKLDQVTLDDIQAMAKKYVDPNNAIYLVVGDRSVKESLAKLSSTNIVEEYDGEGNPVKEDPNAVPEGLTANEVVENYIKALGGREKLESIKDMSVKGEMKMGPMSINVEQLYKGNKMFAMSMVMNGQIMQAIKYNGVSAKVTAQGQTNEAGAEQLKGFKIQAQMCAELNLEALGFTTKLIGVDKFNNKKVYKLELLSADGTKKVDYFCAVTGLKLKTVAQQNGMSITMLYKDYKEVNGLKFPFTTITQMGPQEMPLTITNLEINNNIKDELFN